jgi:hypothetical protein
MTTTPILTGEITINEFLGCEWIREAREISRRRKNKNTKDNGDDKKAGAYRFYNDRRQ